MLPKCSIELSRLLAVHDDERTSISATVSSQSPCVFTRRIPDGRSLRVFDEVGCMPLGISLHQIYKLTGRWSQKLPNLTGSIQRSLFQLHTLRTFVEVKSDFRVICAPIPQFASCNPVRILRLAPRYSHCQVI